MAAPIISFHDVTFTYAGTDSPALQGITLDVGEGEYLALLGLNGAGKTTLQLCINGVVPHMLDGEMTGSVVVDGLDVADYQVREMAKIVGIVFDNPEFQMSQQTVADEVALGLESVGTALDDMRRIIPEVLSLVGLAGFEDRSPLALSGGQQQRLAIAAVLAMRPKILVMDEPTSNLDPVGKQEVLDMAARLNRERGMTVVIAEHEVEVIAEYAHRVVVIDAGRIVLNGPPAEVLSQVDALRARKLRPPQAAEFAALMRRDGAWTGPLPVTTDAAIHQIDALLGRSHG